VSLRRFLTGRCGLAANWGFGKGSFTFTEQDRGMRWVSLLGILCLAGCGVTDNLGAFIGSAFTISSVMAIGRSPVDAVYSLATGKDCSVVRLDGGKSYCRPQEPPPEVPAFCTRSLGVVDCWKDPEALQPRYLGVAAGPSTLTPEQEANRTRRWP
jgi:hypothetical protein